MFDSVRNNKRIVQIFLGLITLPFAFFGIDSYVRNAGAGSDMASVGDTKISIVQFDQALRERQDQLRQQLGANFKPEMLNTPEAKLAVLNSLIDQRVLLLSVELCSVTFQWGDRSKRNLIAASLFADGAAAVLVDGDAASTGRPDAGLQIIGTQSTLWPGTTEIMGWDMVDTGMQVVFSSRIPQIVQTLMRENVAEFLAQHQLTIDDIDHWVLHPGGAKVVGAYESALAIDRERLSHTRAVLRDYGNMSSATVFFVLDAFLKAGAPGPGEYGVLAVLGPGFSCELALVRG